MAWFDNWGNLRYVASQAFVGLLHNKLYPSDTKRARIMLGETGRSYVVSSDCRCCCRVLCCMLSASNLARYFL
jgi:hypothetical protein